MPKIAEIIKTSADPAAGSEIVFTADEDMIVQGLSVSLVTDATGTPRVHLAADDGTAANIFYRAFAAAAQAISVTNTYVAFAGSQQRALTDAIAQLDFPTLGLKLRKGDRLRTITTGIDAGDNYGAMVLQIERQ